ncbi:DNA polymerase iota isoform X1 [Struthio camelus]|uniref:DNA polymerase iota isoform X1 n=2 Tax=Struthio camelus TaxID=8801 RepID=UPI00360423AE
MSQPSGGGMEPFPPPTEDDEEEEDWLRPQSDGRAAPPAPTGPSKSLSARNTACRVIVHIDLDCFYAQVEMIRNPELREKPLGVQQKNIVVTCNYEARKLGIKKLMSVRDAKEKFPQLILVNGEDLTQYREMSYKVTDLLEEFCPLVERLGFDENFVDITEIVEKRLKLLQQTGCSQVCVSGHIYNNETINLQDTMHVRLAIGSRIAEELREAVHARLGLTGCAGVASNKLLAKLVSGTFKPNQQTVLLPESCRDLICNLEHLHKVPGIGYKTTKRLETLGLKSVCDLQAFPSAILEKELGVSTAQRIQKLSYGEDDSPVTPSGPPQSFSEEDSFKKCSSEVQVKEKIEALLANLLDRIHKDGRKPHTIRLATRQFSSTNKWFNRESRQCPIPPHLIQKFGKESSSIISPLVDILMKLFRKMINVDLPFHLTLLSVCFSNLKDLPSSKKGSIGFYLTEVSPPSASGNNVQETEDVSQGQASSSWSQNFNRTGNTPVRKLSEEKQSCIRKAGILDFPFHLSPGDIDQEVFRELPEDIRKEIISERTGETIPTENVFSRPSLCFPKEINSTSPNSKRVNDDMNASGCSIYFRSAHDSATALAHSSSASCSSEYPGSILIDGDIEKDATDSLNFRERDALALEVGASQTVLPAPVFSKDEQAFGTTSEDKTHGSREGIVFPLNVDPKTFFELPADVQKELLAEWKNQELASKMFMGKPPEKPKANRRRKNTASCFSQSNSLLRYFKPQ